MVNDYGEYGKVVIGKLQVVLVWSRAGWTKPALGKVKFNVDAAVMEGGVIGLGVLARNNNGKFVPVALKRLQAELAEVMTLRYGLIVAGAHGFTKVELECDVAMVVKAIR